VNQASVPDEGLRQIWGQLVAEEKVGSLFYSGGIATWSAFLSLLRSPDIAACVVVEMSTGRPVLLAWLTNVSAGSAFVHYATLGRPRRDAGRALLAYWDSLVDDSGEPLLEVLLGITPEHHVDAVRVMRIMGFVSLAVIPRYCVVTRSTGRVGGVLSCRERCSSARDLRGPV
jgi:hypothetical protein